MELQDITTGIMIGQASFRTAMAQHAARKAQGRANDSFIAASIHSAAASAHADGAASLYRKLLASDLEVERLEGKVDDLTDTVDSLTRQRTDLIAHCASLLDEVAMLRARRH